MEPVEEHERIRYVVLDDELARTDPGRFGRLLNAFAAGYADEFHGDEAESPEAWRARIVGASPRLPVMRVAVALRDAQGGDPVVVGGVAAEYYAGSRCILFTYAYVAKALRGQRHASHLLELSRASCAECGPVEAMFGEAEWPQSLKDEHASPEAITRARQRIGFFVRMKAQLVHLDYVQPPLNAGKRAVKHLRLFAFPGNEDDLRENWPRLRVTLKAFLAEFFAALSLETGLPVDGTLLAGLQQAVDDNAQLTMAIPGLRFEHAAVCFHALSRLPDREDVPALERLAGAQCPVFGSLETDLVSRAYRHRRPFRSFSFDFPQSPPPVADLRDDKGPGAARTRTLPVSILFPESVSFHSEGRDEQVQWALRRRDVQAQLAATVFFEARVILWHLVLATRGESSGSAYEVLDELDVIALVKSADDSLRPEADSLSACGEAFGFETRPIGFRLRPPDDPPDHLFGCSLHDLLRHLVTEAEACGIPGTALLPASSALEAPHAATVELLGREPSYYSRDCRPVCGIVTGVFDFNRIDDQEARETVELASEDVRASRRAVAVHHGRVVQIAEKDRSAEDLAKLFGVSAYLVIPHAVLLANEMLVQDCARDLGGAHPRSAKDYRKWISRLERVLRRQWVPNVFFYSSETGLYDVVLLRSGTAAQREELEQVLQQYRTKFEFGTEAARHHFERGLQWLVIFLAVLQIVPVLNGLVDYAVLLKCADVEDGTAITLWCEQFFSRTDRKPISTTTLYVTICAVVILYVFLRPLAIRWLDSRRSEDEPLD